jgi:hypothetical protein
MGDKTKTAKFQASTHASFPHSPPPTLSLSLSVRPQFLEQMNAGTRLLFALGTAMAQSWAVVCAQVGKAGNELDVPTAPPQRRHWPAAELSCRGTP